MAYIEWLGKNTDDEEGLIAYAAAEHERKRIIKLLEEECASDWPKVIEMSLENLIALIKGENK